MIYWLCHQIIGSKDEIAFMFGNFICRVEKRSEILELDLETLIRRSTFELNLLVVSVKQICKAM